MKPVEGYRYYEKVMEKKTEELLFLRWVMGYQFDMDFEQFKKSMKGPGKKSSKEEGEKEIYEKVREILRKD